MESCPTCRPLERRERALLVATALVPLVLAAGVVTLVMVPADPGLALQLLALVVALVSAACAVLLAFEVVGVAVALRRREHVPACRARTVLASLEIPFALLRDGGH